MPSSAAGAPAVGPNGDGGSAGSAGSGGTPGGMPAAGGRGGADTSAGAPSTNTGGAPPAIAGSAGSSGAHAGAAGAASTFDDATFVPDASWTCGMPAGLPPPTRGTLVFRVTLELGATHDVGETQYGGRRVLDVAGGTVTGERLQATVQSGGLELELELENGSVELESLLVLKAADGTPIYLRGCGLSPKGEDSVRFVPDFEVASASSLAWLNTAKLLGTRAVDAAAGKIELAIYDVASVAPSDPRLVLQDPAGVPHQTWECSTATGQRGASVFTEVVGIGASVSVGASKRGTRNIIPITGGTMSGKVAGKVLPGGADFQLLGAASTLDARYTLSTNDDELIVIRNCGAFGALVPQFEARAAGPYAFLNANTFVSSDPGSASGGVSITIYERK
jgi:hypothetical protein